MKKLTFLLVALLVLVVVFTACNGDQSSVDTGTNAATGQTEPIEGTTEPPPAACTHIEGEWIVDAEATYTEEGARHTVCTLCGETVSTEVIPVIPSSEGLAFASNGDGTCYVSAMDACTDAILVIPAKSPAGDSVTAIGENAFYDCDGIATVVIPEGVTEIAMRAFYDCDNLVSIVVPSSMTSIGRMAFNSCDKLVEVVNNSTMKITVGAIGNGSIATAALEVHDGDSKLRNVDGFQFYIDGARIYLLGYVGSETKLTLPESYDGEDYEIYSYAFYGHQTLESVVIPEGVTFIGEYAFYQCARLTDVTVTAPVNIISDYTFTWCRSLVSVDLPDSVMRIGDSAFAECHELVDMKLPGGLKAIGKQAFSECHDLVDLSLPNGIQSIGEYAFSHCHSLTDLVIPEGVTDLSRNTFFWCSALTSVTLHESMAILPDSFFYGCDSLESIVLPKYLEIIGTQAFADCMMLDSIVISANTTLIEDSAFAYCFLLSDVYYTGSEAEWAAITVGAGNEYLLNANIHYGYVPEA